MNYRGPSSDRSNDNGGRVSANESLGSSLSVTNQPCSSLDDSYTNQRTESRRNPAANLQSAAIEQDTMMRLSHEQQLLQDALRRNLVGQSIPAINFPNLRSQPYVPSCVPNPPAARPAEDVVFLTLKLNELDLEINAIEVLVLSLDRSLGNAIDPGFAAYEMARGQDPSYVANPKFKIEFLRAEHYDSRKAARRLLAYLREKLELFGITKLTRDIFLEDLGDDGQKILTLGVLQVLPKRDLEGRCVVWIAHVLPPNMQGLVLGVRKAFFYFLTSLAEDDDEVSKVKGIVCISWRVHKPVDLSQSAILEKAIYEIKESSPNRISAYHLCLNPISFDVNVVNAFSALILPMITKAGFIQSTRTHYGNAVECQYTLLKEYGCPVHCFPLNNNSNHHEGSCTTGSHIDNRHVQEWMTRRMQVETEKKKNLGSAKNLAHSISLGSTQKETISINPSSNGSSGDSSLSSSPTLGNSFVEDPGTTKDSEMHPSESHHHGLAWLSDRINNAPANSLLVATGAASETEHLGSDGSKGSSGSKGSILNESIATSHSSDFDSRGELKLGTKPMDIDSSPPYGDTPVLVADGSASHGNGVLPSSTNDNGQDTSGITESVISGDNVRPNDVLLGRGRPLQKHSGNIRMRNMVADKFDQHETSTKKEKSRLSASIVQTIAIEGGRFLKAAVPLTQPMAPVPPKSAEMLWTEIDEEEARNKVAYTFRTLRKMKKEDAAANFLKDRDFKSS